MHVIMGATGHVGAACVEALLAQNQPVLALLHSPDKAAALEAKGAETAVVDARDPDALRAAFRRGRRAFLLNPPAAPATDTDAEETATVRAILAAVDGSSLEKVVAESTMGAVAGEALAPRTGDSSVLYGLEKGLAAQPIPAAINRAGYYFSNFDLQLDAVRDTGELQTMFPADFALPMVAPVDLGRAAARRLTSGLDDIGVVSIEGPTRPVFADVAAAFAQALDRPVRVVATPRDGWIAAFRAQGFSASAADAYARMTQVAIDGPKTPVAETEKGQITLEAYICKLVRR
ncbi:MAG: NAD-dependent epimerase/dehydratase family protein [Brevundimonas sp.]|nr:MAG: NAD-dependent epimerase/dehydratase family protein [Brevundimonas sp.]